MQAGSECRNFPVSCMCGVQDVINILINVRLMTVHLLKKLLSCKSTEPPYPGAKLPQRGTSTAEPLQTVQSTEINKCIGMNIRHWYKNFLLRASI